MKDEYVVVGKLGSTYGIRGYLKVFSYTQEKTDILNFNPLYLESKPRGDALKLENSKDLGKTNILGNNHPEWNPIEVESGREHGKLVILKFKNYDNPEESRLLTGKRLAVLKSQLPELKNDEFYWRDLEGLEVVNQNNEVLGQVAYIIATGANDVIVVKQNNKEHAIPYLTDVIIKVDLIKKIIHVNWDLL